MIFGYERYRLLSLEFAAPVLTIPHCGTLLAPLHKALLQKLKAMRTFPLVMCSAHVDIGRLYLRSQEVTYGAQAIHRLVSFFTSCTPSKLLLITAIEYHYLEIGVEDLFLSTSYTLLSELVTSTWITHLW